MVLDEVALPGEGPRIRVAQISDVDFGGIGVRERQAQRMLEGPARPDLLVVTGDLLEFRRGRGDRWLPEAVAFLDRLPAPLGIYWVVGESERHHMSTLRRELRGSRVTMLFNEEVTLSVEGREVSLFGLGSSHARFESTSSEGRRMIRAHGSGLFSPLVDAAAGADRWQDYEISGDLRFDDPEDYVGVMAYVRPDRPDRGYALVRHRDRNGFHLRILGAGRRLMGTTDGGPAIPSGVPLRYRFQVETGPEANRLRARVWRRGEEEPESWQLDARDPSAARPRGGAVGICVKGGGNERYFAPWEVRSISGGELLRRRDLAGFDAADGSWRFLSVLRDWAMPTGDSRPFRLLLAHNPDVVLDLEAQGVGEIDLILAGHTQGGQIRLPWVGALYTGTELGTAYDAGLFRIRERLVYINRGLGTSFLPVRFLCPPEVTALSVPLGGIDSAVGEGA